MFSGALTPPIGRGDNPTAGTRSVKERFFLGGQSPWGGRVFRHPRPATCSRSEVSIHERLAYMGLEETVAGLSCKSDKHVCLFITFGKRIPSLGEHVLNFLGPHVEVRSFK